MRQSSCVSRTERNRGDREWKDLLLESLLFLVAERLESVVELGEDIAGLKSDEFRALGLGWR